MAKHITQEKKKEIVEYYKARPMTTAELAKEYGLSIPTVLKILNEYRVKRYTKVQLFSPDLREDYFSEIDTERKAYFLGLIITDGCVHNTKGRQSLVSITLQDKDSYILDEFKKEIRSNKKITSDGRGCSELNILSNKMVQDLKKYGVQERKSFNTTFPLNISDTLYPHLIRGIFDGDGSASYYARPKRKSHVKAIRFCQANRDFLIAIVDKLYEQCDIAKIHLYQEKERLWSIAYRKDISMMKLINYMYRDATIYLTRKKKLCDLIYDECAKYIDGSTEITKESNESLAS